MTWQLNDMLRTSSPRDDISSSPERSTQGSEEGRQVIWKFCNKGQVVGTTCNKRQVV